VSDPDAIKRILVTNVKNYVKPNEFEFIKNFVGEGSHSISPLSYHRNRRIIHMGIGLVTSEGLKHARDKKHIAPAFAFTHLKHSFAPIFVTQARAATDTLALLLHLRLVSSYLCCNQLS
jgi:hypothetical protein